MSDGVPTVEFADQVLLMDGGMGQEIRRRSGVGDAPLWSAQVMMNDPDLVQKTHEDYIRAGARLITTNTYASTRWRMARVGAEAQFSDLNRIGGALAHQARDNSGEPVLIAGCLPPLLKSYRPELVRSFEENEPMYREQAELLAPYVDLFLCETMSTADEARAAVSGAAGVGKPIWVSWTLHDEGRTTLRSDETIAEAARALEGLPVSAFLANCCWPESITAVMPELLALNKGPIGGHANGFTGIPPGWSVGQGVSLLERRLDLDPEAYARHVDAWIDGGATVVGGCCEVGPAHIARLRRLLDAACG